METDEVMLQFDDLERKINNLIERCNTAEAAGSELTIRIEKLESELQAKEDMLNRYSQQKVQVRSKIGDLLTRLNNIS
ncbi:MAG: hypothetical protein GXP53_11725 [Deltaproteobacteria bacterium]|nr:hypothetical protein [Deltaproteobacteria bacterium]